MLKSLIHLSAATLFAVVLAALLSAMPQQTATAQARGTKAAPAAPAAAPPPDVLAKARSIYKIDCAVCHGDNGSGKTDLAASMSLTMPDFSNPATLASVSDKDLFDQIRNGKDKMPPEDTGRAKDDEVRNLIVYIRSLSQPQTATAAAQ